MKKLFLVSVSVLCLLLFSATAKAGTITIDFENDTTSVIDFYSLQGINFNFIPTAENPDDSFAAIAGTEIPANSTNTTNKLQLFKTKLEITFDASLVLTYFSAYKYEPYSSSMTVVWNFINDQGTTISSIENSTKDLWEEIDAAVFAANQNISKIEIYGKDNTNMFYLDDLKFTFDQIITAPEPASFLLLVVGFIGLIGLRRKSEK